MVDRQVTEAVVDTAAPTLPIGSRLRAAREKVGLSVIQTAERLHLDPAVIQALEAERFEELGAPVYVRGHMRRYAEFLGEPNEALQDRYAQMQESGVAPDLRQAPRALPQSDPRRYLWPAVIIAGLFVLGGILWWALSAQPAPPRT